jgi:hypothetical protein
MPTQKTQIIRHVFGGGWATDFGQTVDAVPDGSGKIVLPYLLNAQDVLFELDGGPHKIGGASKVNSAAAESGAVVTGCYDYWRQATGGTPTRRRVIHAGAKVLADADDAVFSNALFTGLVSGAVPSYFTFDDLLIISSDATADVPRSWDQTTAQNLAGSPPRFSFGCAHKNRAWAAGNFSAPSRLYYSANTDPEDWIGSGSGSIDIDPNDGDIITGIASHKDELWAFKGPNKGSIHRITGSSPTGSDAFARKNFVNGIGAAWHNSIFRFGDDLGFVSQYGSVHSLSATAAYGDFFDAALSRPFNGWLKDHLNYNRLRYIWAVTDPLRGLVFIVCSVDSSTTNNFMLVMDYRLAPENIRWSYSIVHKHASLGLFVDSNGLRRILGGGNDGYVRRLNVADRSIDSGTAIVSKVTTPSLNYGTPFIMKTAEGAAIGVVPKGNFDVTFGWTRDNNTQQTATITQGGGALLGTFLLGTDMLDGGKYRDRFNPMEEGGEFRSVQYEISSGGVDQDFELHAFATKVSYGAESMEA